MSARCVCLLVVACTPFVLPPALAENLIVNPGFEDGFDGWVREGTVYLGPPRSGAHSAMIEAYMDEYGVSFGMICQDIQVEPGVLYRLEFWYKNDPPGLPEADLAFYDAYGQYLESHFMDLPPSYGAWDFVELSAQAPAAAAICRFRVDCTVPIPNQPGFTYLDDTALIPHTGTAACCVDMDCHVLTGSECADLGGLWLPGHASCDPNPCPSIVTVNPEGTGDYATIQEAIDGVVEGSIISLAYGLYTGAGNRDLDMRGKALTLRSTHNEPEQCIIDCQGSASEPHRGILMDSGEGPDTVIEGITIRNGYIGDTNAGGGGIRCDGSSPVIRTCIISNCHAWFAGAFYSRYASAHLEECRFEDNYGMNGVVTFSSSAALPRVERCVFAGNAGANGTGLALYAVAAEGVVSECRFTGNGGKVIVHGQGWRIEGCTFDSNYGTSILSTYTTDPEIVSCTIVGNTCSLGAIVTVSGGYPEISHTLICDNHSGPAVMAETDGYPLFTCSDINGNEGGDWTGPIASQYGANGNTSMDPMFCYAQYDDFTIAADSPCAPATPPNPECDLIGAWPAGCGEVAACCVGYECELLPELACAWAGGIWHGDTYACYPNPCLPVAVCCIEEECVLVNSQVCADAGGEFHSGLTSCDPNPCIAGPDPTDLTGGVFIVHAAPGQAWSPGTDWCQVYYDDLQLANSNEQVPRIDPENPGSEISIWYVLSGWDEEKEWCLTTFGLGDFDENLFSFVGWGHCSGGGIEIATGSWPAPLEGTIISHADAWSGMYEPLYYFAGYAYYQGQVPLDVHPSEAFGGFDNCLIPTERFEAECFGALGIFCDGIPCHPGGIAAVPVQTPEQERPTAFWARPNPVRTGTSLYYEVSATGEIMLEIFDASGRLVRRLRPEDSLHRSGAIEWDGNTCAGEAAGPGVYFARLSCGTQVQCQRMVVIR